MLGYEDSLKYLDGFVDYERKPPNGPAARNMGLERVAMLLAALGNPQSRMKCIHVAGTKGKGSVCAMIASVFRAAGYRTGLYTSPHLVDVRERIQVDGALIPPEAFARLMERTRPHLDRIREQIENLPPGAVLRRPTYFEIMTHIAFLYFEEAKVDMAVLEVGMGGRLDATNVIEHPVACAITNIGYDHCAILGNGLGQIAREKAGILKPGSPAVTALQRPSAMRAIASVARHVGAPLWRVGREVTIESSSPSGEFTVRTPHGTYPDLAIPLLGSHQRENAAVAVALAELARLAGFERITREAVREGLACVEWPGRIQRVAERPETVLDGAHNPESAAALAKTLREHFGGEPPVYVFAVAEDKDWRRILRILKPRHRAIVFTTSGNPRAVAPSVLAGEASRMGFEGVRVEEDPERALALARELAGPDGLVVATGSLYLVGKLLPLFRDSRASPEHRGAA